MVSVLWDENEPAWTVPVLLTDLLAQLNELHLRWHVAHGPHALAQVFVTDVAFLVPVKLHKRLSQLWQKTHKTHFTSTLAPGARRGKTLKVEGGGREGEGRVLTVDLLRSQLSVLWKETQTRCKSHVHLNFPEPIAHNLPSQRLSGTR